MRRSCSNGRIKNLYV